MSALAAPDLWIIAGYFLAIALGGWWASRRRGDTRDFFLAGRQVPWPAVLLSITATEISAVTFLGVPGTGYGGNLGYLQFGIGSLAARFLVAFLFLPAFYRARVVSIYEYLAGRFGGGTHRTAAIFFLLSRLNASAIRLLLAATGLSLFFGVPLFWAVVLFTGVALLYTAAGGIRAVIWTDCVQALVFIGGGLAALFFLVQAAGGWEAFWSAAGERGQLRWIQWTPREGESWWSDWNVVYLAVLNGLVLTTAALGCDQDLTQRMLTCRSTGRAQWSVVLSGFLGIPVAAVFLLTGVALAVAGPALAGGGPPAELGANEVFAWFIAESAPAGLKGLLLVGIFATAMSSLDSAVNALSSSALYDLLGPRWRQSVRAPRVGILVAGLLLAGLALGLAGYRESFVWLGFKIVGITYGSLLGVFLLGLTTRAPRGDDRGNLVAMLTGALVSAVLLAGIELADWPLGWTWIPLLNAALTYGIAFWLGRPRVPAVSR